jgi:outer membrane usher protein
VAVLFDVTVNGEGAGAARLMRRPDGRLYARRADLERWRLRVPASAEQLDFLGESHVPLDAFPGMSARVDEATQALALDIPPAFFATTVVQGMAARPVRAQPPRPGAFLNYDLYHARSAAGSLAPATRATTGLFDLGVFGPLGTGTTGLLLEEHGGAAPSRQVRLDTTWTIDFPERRRTLWLGDAVGSSGTWGRPVRYGGLRFGTNFATDPTFVTFPMPGLGGEAALPTVTDLYIDGVLRQSTTMPPGPFRISDLPVITGQGEVRLVMRDLLGREQVVVLPYYASSRLLRQGLVDESFEIGRIRENYGLRSNDYGRSIAAWQRRQGLTDALTTELRLEATRDVRTGGLGATFAVPGWGVVTAAGALSHGPGGSGTLAQAAYERQSHRGLSFGVRGQWTSPEFAQIGLAPGVAPPLRQFSASLGTSMGKAGSIGLGYVRQDNRGREGAEIASLGYTLSLGRTSALVLSAFRSMAPDRTHGVTLSLVMALDSSTSGSATVNGPGADPRMQVQLQRALPPGTGTGYRVLAVSGASGARGEAGVSHQNDFGTYVLEVGRADGIDALRASASGSLAVLDGRPFVARRLGEAFGVVHVPGFSDVGVLLNNQPVARTDRDGYALLPRLLPFMPNPVRLETADLPMDVTIGSDALDAVPYARTGALVRFPVRRSEGALIALVLDDGGPMPAGAEVRIVGRDGSFPVAYRGEAYVTGLGGPQQLVATWREQRCEFEVDPGESTGAIPRIGPILCAGVAR